MIMSFRTIPYLQTYKEIYSQNKSLKKAIVLYVQKENDAPYERFRRINGVVLKIVGGNQAHFLIIQNHIPPHFQRALEERFNRLKSTITALKQGQRARLYHQPYIGKLFRKHGKDAVDRETLSTYDFLSSPLIPLGWLDKNIRHDLISNLITEQEYATFLLDKFLEDSEKLEVEEIYYIEALIGKANVCMYQGKPYTFAQALFDWSRFTHDNKLTFDILKPSLKFSRNVLEEIKSTIITKEMFVNKYPSFKYFRVYVTCIALAENFNRSKKWRLSFDLEKYIQIFSESERIRAVYSFYAFSSPDVLIVRPPIVTYLRNSESENISLKSLALFNSHRYFYALEKRLPSYVESKYRESKTERKQEIPLTRSQSSSPEGYVDRILQLRDIEQDPCYENWLSLKNIKVKIDKDHYKRTLERLGEFFKTYEPSRKYEFFTFYAMITNFNKFQDCLSYVNKWKTEKKINKIFPILCELFQQKEPKNIYNLITILFESPFLRLDRKQIQLLIRQSSTYPPKQILACYEKFQEIIPSELRKHFTTTFSKGLFYLLLDPTYSNGRWHRKAWLGETYIIPVTNIFSSEYKIDTDEFFKFCRECFTKKKIQSEHFESLAFFQSRMESLDECPYKHRNTLSPSDKMSILTQFASDNWNSLNESDVRLYFGIREKVKGEGGSKIINHRGYIEKLQDLEKLGSFTFTEKEKLQLYFHWLKIQNLTKKQPDLKTQFRFITLLGEYFENFLSKKDVILLLSNPCIAVEENINALDVMIQCRDRFKAERDSFTLDPSNLKIWEKQVESLKPSSNLMDNNNKLAKLLTSLHMECYNIIPRDQTLSDCFLIKSITKSGIVFSQNMRPSPPLANNVVVSTRWNHSTETGEAILNITIKRDSLKESVSLKFFETDNLPMTLPQETFFKYLHGLAVIVLAERNGQKKIEKLTQNNIMICFPTVKKEVFTTLKTIGFIEPICSFLNNLKIKVRKLLWKIMFPKQETIIRIHTEGKCREKKMFYKPD